MQVEVLHDVSVTSVSASESLVNHVHRVMHLSGLANDKKLMGTHSGFVHYRKRGALRRMNKFKATTVIHGLDTRASSTRHGNIIKFAACRTLHALRQTKRPSFTDSNAVVSKSNTSLTKTIAKRDRRGGEQFEQWKREQAIDNKTRIQIRPAQRTARSAKRMATDAQAREASSECKPEMSATAPRPPIPPLGNKSRKRAAAAELSLPSI